MEFKKIHSDLIIETNDKQFISSAEKDIINNIDNNLNIDISLYAKIDSPEFTGYPSIKNKGAILNESTPINGGYF